MTQTSSSVANQMPHMAQALAHAQALVTATDTEEGGPRGGVSQRPSSENISTGASVGFVQPGQSNDGSHGEHHAPVSNTHNRNFNTPTGETSYEMPTRLSTLPSFAATSEAIANSNAMNLFSNVDNEMELISATRGGAPFTQLSSSGSGTRGMPLDTMHVTTSSPAFPLLNGANNIENTVPRQIQSSPVSSITNGYISGLRSMLHDQHGLEQNGVPANVSENGPDNPQIVRPTTFDRRRFKQKILLVKLCSIINDVKKCSPDDIPIINDLLESVRDPALNDNDFGYALMWIQHIINGNYHKSPNRITLADRAFGSVKRIIESQSQTLKDLLIDSAVITQEIDNVLGVLNIRSHENLYALYLEQDSDVHERILDQQPNDPFAAAKQIGGSCAAILVDVALRWLTQKLDNSKKSQMDNRQPFINAESQIEKDHSIPQSISQTNGKSRKRRSTYETGYVPRKMIRSKKSVLQNTSPKRRFYETKKVVDNTGEDTLPTANEAVNPMETVVVECETPAGIFYPNARIQPQHNSKKGSRRYCRGNDHEHTLACKTVIGLGVPDAGIDVLGCIANRERDADNGSGSLGNGESEILDGDVASPYEIPNSQPVITTQNVGLSQKVGPTGSTSKIYNTKRAVTTIPLISTHIDAEGEPLNRMQSTNPADKSDDALDVEMQSRSGEGLQDSSITEGDGINCADNDEDDDDGDSDNEDYAGNTNIINQNYDDDDELNGNSRRGNDLHENGDDNYEDDDELDGDGRRGSDLHENGDDNYEDDDEESCQGEDDSVNGRECITKF
jgi:hypothetical protein